MRRRNHRAITSRTCLVAIAAGLWIALITGSLLWNWRTIGEANNVLARSEARSGFEKDILYRRWAAMHGGVYVPVTADTPPNPYLAHLPNRDITTLDGRKLTLVNPAYMTRQVHELAAQQDGARGHITSLTPLRAENAADAWETAALQTFETGSKEASSVEIINSQPYLRLMRPLVTEASCLKCHATQGYKAGDIRGGISISVPYAPYAAATSEHRAGMATAHGLVGSIGLVGLLAANMLLGRSERKLRSSEGRLAATLHSMGDGVISTDAKGSVTSLNAVAETLTGWSTADAVGRPVDEIFGLIAADTRREIANPIHQVLQHGEPATLPDNAMLIARDGTTRHIADSCAPIRDEHGDLFGAVLVFRDVTEHRHMEEELRLAARTDRLTSLPNRTALLERLQQAVNRAGRVRGYHFAVLFLDCDRFKVINDSLGHEAGDVMLREVGMRMRDALRTGDTIARHSQAIAARLGGDEFVALLDGLASPADAITVADRLLEALSRAYRLGKHEVVSTVSIGIVTSNVSCQSADLVLRDADTAMYEAKAAGKGRYVVFDAAMRLRAEKRLHVENDLRHAIEAGQLFLMYQPIVSLSTGQVEAFEALLRWNHPEQGLISPSDFIPIAEETGLILPIGHWVLNEACRQFAQWRRDLGDAAPQSLSINLSRKQLALPELPASIEQILKLHAVPPGSIHLEVTESQIMHDLQASVAVLNRLKQVGMKIDIDDFGTGYSSLSCLRQFPIDTLKIDRSFVANLEHGRDFSALLQAVTHLASNLGINVVAEGIETMAQLAVLQSLGCERGQGYLFSRPLPADQAPHFRVALPQLQASADAPVGLWPAGHSTCELAGR